MHPYYLLEYQGERHSLRIIQNCGSLLFSSKAQLLFLSLTIAAVTAGTSLSENLIGLPKSSASTDKSIIVTAPVEVYLFESASIHSYCISLELSEKRNYLYSFFQKNFLSIFCSCCSICTINICINSFCIITCYRCSTYHEYILIFYSCILKCINYFFH